MSRSRASRRAWRRVGLSAARRAPRARRARAGRALPRLDLLGPARPGLRRPGGPAAGRRPRARGARRQPDGPRLHRRRERQLALPRRCTRPGSRTSRRPSQPTTGSACSDAYVTATARCAPPENRRCRTSWRAAARFLVEELALLHRLRVVVALGKIAHDGFLAALTARGDAVPRPRPPFAHGAEHVLPNGSRAPVLVPPEPAEHVHGTADASDARCRVRARPRALRGRTWRDGAPPRLNDARAAAGAWASAERAWSDGTRPLLVVPPIDG